MQLIETNPTALLETLLNGHKYIRPTFSIGPINSGLIQHYIV